MVFVDANVAMYLVGAAHPNKIDAQRRLERLVVERTRLVTDAEAMNEILHRYTSLDRRATIQPAFDAMLGVVDDVLPIGRETLSSRSNSCCSTRRCPCGPRCTWR